MSRILRRPNRDVMRFTGQIAGIGTTSGIRLVVGIWAESPFGAFADVMVQQADGHRVLVAPNLEVAHFIETTYTFDEVRLDRVEVMCTKGRYVITTRDLALQVDTGGRSPVGFLLAALPRRLATWPRWLMLVNPLAKLLLKGVRTAGSARAGRREFYGAYDAHKILAVDGSWRGGALGSLAHVEPVTFGFGSTPRSPSITSLVTTVFQPRLTRQPKIR